MTRYENAQQEVNLTHLADPLARIATVLAEVSTELEQLSERVGANDVTSGAPQYRRGEPVDTSFAEPSTAPTSLTAPAASAAGASPFTGDRRVGLAGWQRWRGRASPALWAAGTFLVLGILLLLLLLTQR